MKPILGWVRSKVSLLTTYVIILSGLLGLFLVQSNSLIPGQNRFETLVVNRINDYQYPWRNAIDAPFILISKIFTFFGFEPITAGRLTSSILMILSIFLLYQLLRTWLLSPSKAMVGTLLFSVSSWTLVVGRGAHTITMGIFLLLLIFSLSTRLFFTTRPLLDWLLLVIASTLSLYTPLLPWLMFLASMVALFHIRQRTRAAPLRTREKVLVVGTGILLVLPLIISLILNAHQILILLGVDNLVSSPSALILSIINTVSALFFVSESSNVLGLDSLPFLDIFSVFMFILGCYYFENKLHLKRSKLLFGGLALGILVCSLGGFDPLRMSLLLPIIYIFIAAGIHETISRWLAVFPRNPIARTIGILSLASVVGFVSFYHLTKTFVARPGNPQIRNSYTLNNND